MVLDQDHLMVRDALRTFVRNAITPYAAQWDRDRTFPANVHRQLGALGAYGVLVPEAYGGAGLDALALALILEEIAAGDGGTSTAVSVNNCPVCSILLTYGDDAQKRDWLTPLARGEMLGAFCLTEPQAGSDASAFAHHGRTGRRRQRLRAQRRQAVHHERQARQCRDRDGRHRQIGRQARHQRVHRADRYAGLRRGARRRQARPAFVGYRADRVRSMPRAGGQPDRRGRRTATGSRCPGSKAGASASRRKVSASRAPRSKQRSRMRTSVRASASLCSSIRRCSSASPIWRRSSKRRGS